MLQRVVIKTNAKESLKPLLEMAIRNQLKSMQHGIRHTKERVAKFEKRAGMASVEFEKKLQAEEIDETIETIDLNMELVVLRLLESQYQSLNDAKIS
jgi:hypothetical protein